MEKIVKISIRNLYKIFGEQPEIALNHIRNGISKVDLLEEYQHVLGLQEINVDMGEGQITVIMGLSGSGKSTLIRHLNRLIEPTSGGIDVDGEDVLAYDDTRLRDLRRETMSMVFQKFALFTKSLSICFWFDSERFWDVNHYYKGFFNQCSIFGAEIRIF